MLRSSGFFRGIECPYGQACGRPYCHFRHPPGAHHTTDGPIPPRRLLALSGPSRRPATVGGCGYDPYNPKLPKPVAQESNDTLENIVSSASGILELELFDKAIEAAKNEVEREQKKYEELLETTKEYGSSEAPLLASKASGLATSNPFGSLEYKPSSYNANCGNDYNPTPLAVAASSQSRKYTLDSFNNTKCKGSSLEYVPTVVTQPKKYSSSSVVTNKYIIDNSKPSTDLEYDPLSNYSARLLSKAKEQKGTKRKREADREEAYSPSFKKYCDETSNDEPIARFSDSEDEGHEASTVPLKSKGGSESKLGAAKEKPQTETSSRQMKETAVQYDMGDIESPQSAAVKDLGEKNARLVKGPSNRDAKVKEKNKVASKDKLKGKKEDEHKAQGKKNQDKMGHKEKMDAKAQHKNGERSKEKPSKPHVDRHALKLNKPKSPITPGTKEESSGKNKEVGKAAAAKISGTSRKESKHQPVELKRKHQISSGTEHKKQKDKQPASKRPKETLTCSQAKENSEAKRKVKQQSLSHVDLFGDESEEEEQVGQPFLPFPDLSSDSDRDDAGSSSPYDNGMANVKKLKLSRAPPPPPSSSSSSDYEIDYSALEKDLDFECDPMEECLRIFNESTDVKTEDKGRLGKQVSKEEGGEEKLTEDNLTTLFPGQKKRISHATKQGHVEVPSKPVIRPYRPPTAQEVCYQRIQQAQKQAVQLAQQRPKQPLPTAKLPVAAQRTPIVMHKGERKRVAHVPSAALSAVSKLVPGNLKRTIPPARVASSNGVDAPTLKARTLTGMASKTTTTAVPKRIAHTPTLQSTTLKRPVIPTEYGAKVPTNVRQRYLNLFIDECLKSSPSQQGAFDKALAEEKVVYERSTSRNIYLNVAVNTLKKLRTLLPSPSQQVQKASNIKVVSHEAMLGGKLAARTSYTFNRSTSLRIEDLTGAALYRRLKEYVLTEDELKEHGYPLPCPERSGRAVVFAAEEKKMTDGSCRICCRCGTEYMVSPSGNCVRKEECIHHWGKLRKQRVPGGWETHYSCCSGAVGSLGCQVAKTKRTDMIYYLRGAIAHPLLAFPSLGYSLQPPQPTPEGCALLAGTQSSAFGKVLMPNHLADFKMPSQESVKSYQDETQTGQDFTWVVKANNRAYHAQIRKKHLWCLKKRKYAVNAIKTAKYNFFTFLPLNLFEQFHRMANVYFLFMILLQTFPQISTLPWFALLFPLAILLSIRGIRDLIDDIARHKSDGEINNRPCEILTDGSFCKRKWCDIQVGDIVCLHKDSFVPADLLLLSTSEPNSLCYVETMDIDGETNLKYRQALLVTHEQLTSADNMAAFDGEVVCEEPNSRLHNFIGTLEWHGEKYPLDCEKILLRGCRVRNTEVCYGLVIYAGFDTKIMKNCGKIKLKKTKLCHLMDRLVLLITVSLLLISFGLAVGSGIWATKFFQEHSYLFNFYRHTSAASYAFFAFWGFLILLSLVIPMSMLITFEFIYLVNSCFINWDMEMYYAEKDTPAKARSTSLNDQLGQIEYIFSDKTGTLTQNVMTFKKCCINGIIYGSSKTECKSMDLSWNKYIDKKLEFHDPLLLETIRRDQDPVVREYMRLLALCHTVMVEEKENELVYQAASPDEEALVTAARNLGYVFLSRTQDTITISELGIPRTYKVLALLDFNSVRKRMSVLVQDPEGCIKLYTKGADSVILERLHSDRINEGCTIKALDSFAAETLRTLCLAMKEVDEQDYALWRKKHHAASILLQGRAQELDKVYEEIEQNLKLLGATAIEDKLQDGVPETIHLLKRGDIKVWVLTGDKQETAVNIGFACQLLSEDMTILEESEISEILEPSWYSSNSLAGSGEALCDIGSFLPYQASGAHVKKALVVTGDFLEKIFHTEGDKKLKKKKSLLERFRFRTKDTVKEHGNLIEKAFVELATTCQAVICCRVTPKQKALIVQMVKRHKNAISLAIGDGANDVNMIKTADIGVGISGQEGMQAVQCSDYALAQFRYLQRLLFVHGKWSYLRICKFLRYFFFKTFAGMMVQIWFAFYTGFTAQPLLEGWFLALYNVIYTSFPVLCLGLFEQDVNAKKSLQFPELYKAGQKDLFFNYWIFFVSFVHGSFVSLANFYVTTWAMGDRSGTRVTGDYQSFGMIVATSAILSVLAEIMLELKFWTVFSSLAIFISLLLYCLFTYFTQNFQAYTTSPLMFPFPEATRNALTDPTSVLVILLCVVVNIIPSLAIRFVYNTISPPTMSEMFQVREIQKKQSTVELTSHHSRNSPLRRSSYAFSHKEGYAHLIAKGASLRSKPAPVHRQLNGLFSNHNPGKDNSLPTETNAAPEEASAEQKIHFR